MRNKLTAIVMFAGLIWLAIRHPRQLTAEIHGPELDAAR